jgi:hypothetical protein
VGAPESPAAVLTPPAPTSPLPAVSVALLERMPGKPQVSEGSVETRKRRQWSGVLWRNYGMTIEDYEARLEAQGGVCAICLAEPGKRRLAVDHDHDSGRVRGLLCSQCNTGLGSLQDDPDLVWLAFQYLEGGGVEFDWASEVGA